jgi:bacterioferritin-associated ferredoxin
MPDPAMNAMVREAVIAMALGAGLFVLFIALRPMRGCGGQCGDCTSDCALKHVEKP